MLLFHTHVPQKVMFIEHLREVCLLSDVIDITLKINMICRTVTVHINVGFCGLEKLGDFLMNVKFIILLFLILAIQKEI